MPYGRTTKEQRDERIEFAVGLVAEHGTPRGVWRRVAIKFKCGKGAARRYVRAAQTLIGADLPAVVHAERLRVRRQLDAMIAGAKPRLRLAAIKIKIDLLGLAAPKRIEAEVTTKPFDPLTAYAADPALRDRALQLERDIADADKTLGAVKAGSPGIPGLAVPPASTEAGGNGHAAIDRSRLQPPDRPNPGANGEKRLL